MVTSKHRSGGNPSYRTVRWALAGLGVTAVGFVGFGLAAWRRHDPVPSPIENASWQAQLSVSVHHEPLSTGTGQPESELAADESLRAIKGYAGIDACRSCHAEQYESFLATSHSRSARPVRCGVEPEGTSFFHALSNRHYDVVHTDQRFDHVETQRDSQQNPVAVQTKPMAFAIGSGAHAITYLGWDDGFLQESPLTWYRGSNQWGMSPGYDSPNHPSFRRTADANCVYCHVGQIEYLAPASTKYTIIEPTIGCERCHGGGQAHIQYHQNPARDGKSDPIFRPAEDDRIAGEAICQQCHLQGERLIASEGESPWDFVPGESIVQSRTDYSLTRDSENKVVGHVEQLHLSQCYLHSETLTCTTCHHPHQPPSSKPKMAIYREACLKCHEDQACGVSSDLRQNQNGNDCSHCHMPKTDTNVTHAALHQHQIGIYPQENPPVPAEALIALVPDQAVGVPESRRRLLLATLYSSGLRPADVGSQQVLAAVYLGLKSLEPIQHRWPEASIAMASILFQLGKADDARKLLGVLDIDRMSGPNRALAWGLLGELEWLEGNSAEALVCFETLSKLRREPNDHYRLGMCHLDLGNEREATRAIEQSLRIQPDFRAAHQALAEILGPTDPRRAEVHRRVLERLMEKEPGR